MIQISRTEGQVCRALYRRDFLSVADHTTPGGPLLSAARHGADAGSIARVYLARHQCTVLLSDMA
jgi:hypothetical protein